MNEDYEIRVSFLIQNTSHLFYPVLWFEVILGYFAAISMTLILIPLFWPFVWLALGCPLKAPKGKR